MYLSPPRFAGSRTVTTPARYEITVTPPDAGKKKTRVHVAADQVSPASRMSSEWHYWAPRPGQNLGPGRLYWTRFYIGTDPDFYNQGLRWGVSMGGTAQEFRRSALYLPGGGINLPNGKYMIAIRQNAAGKKEVVIGKEDRGCDKRVLNALHQGLRPETNQFDEILGVSNHSMLISRGKPYEPGSSDSDEFSAAFAGEIEVVNHRINTINDQTGQIFGPNGLVKPPSEAAIPADLAMKQPGYEEGKSAALKNARDTLAQITGDDDIRLVKVTFVNDGLDEASLRQPRDLGLKKIDAAALAAILEEPEIQGLFDQLVNDPEAQMRLVEGLARHGELRYAVQDLRHKLVERGTLKPEQATSLAVEVLSTPEAMGLFMPASPAFIPGLSDNTKRKLVTAYNRMDPETRPEFRKLVRDLKGRRNLVRFLTGQRIPGSLFRLALPEPERADKAAGLVKHIFDTALVLSKEEPHDLSGTHVTLIGHVGTAGKQLRELESKARRHGGKGMTVVIQNNPFNGSILKMEALRDNIARLKRLQQRGVTVYASPDFKTNRAYEYLTDLFVFAHPPMTGEDAVERQDTRHLLKAYGVDPDALHAFARARFKKRWANNQIVAAYALQDKAFRRFLRDVDWSVSLPLATV